MLLFQDFSVKVTVRALSCSFYIPDESLTRSV